MIEKFKAVKLSNEQMKKVNGGECTNFGAFQTCLQSGQSYALCLGHCWYEL